MNKNIYLIIALLSVSFLSFVSCKETSGLDEYADWQTRNESYIDFVAKEARANEGEEPGKWKVIKSYLLDPDVGNVTSNNSNYVYARINKVGTGKTPLYSDTISVYYRGTLINGTLFDKSAAFTPQNSLSTDTIFADKPNDSYGDIFKHIVYFPDVDILVPSNLRLSRMITGWITAVQKMKEGDFWTIYVPSQLGYGGSAQSAVPGNSMLIFDLYLQKAYLK